MNGEAVSWASFPITFIDDPNFYIRSSNSRRRGRGREATGHNQVLIALARRRCDVLFAMLPDGALYEAPQAQVA
jgi:hypothetical protein